MCFRLESPTRSLVMEAPKGVEINAEAGNMEATCRTELRLESKDGEVRARKAHVSERPTFPKAGLQQLCTASTKGVNQKVLFHDTKS